tara:strand:+ start:85763 stop:87349 length:1587 start_codon:yes stop_codon:yes gene_type:complete
MTKIKRRLFIKQASISTAGLTYLAPTMFLQGCTDKSSAKKFELDFNTIKPISSDDFVLAKGFKSEVFLSKGDILNSAGEMFGSNNDYIACVSLNEKEAIMWVNHEYPNTLFVSGWRYGDKKKNKKQVDLERQSVGGSLVHIKLENGQWKVVKNSKYNRRISGETKIPISAPRELSGSKVAIGTLANCAGGVTPWNTFLTCEENYDNFYGERMADGSTSPSPLMWEKFYKQPPEHYGWVVEVNPKTGESKKLTSLGRFAHESATCVVAKNGKTVVYSGDDRNDQFVYKFVSSELNSLEVGELFVADIKNGKWISLDIEKQPLLKKRFKDQTEVQVNCREAGKILGATPLDRPEDIEVHPKTGEVFIALTNNKKRKNYFGSILKITPHNGDHGSDKMTATDFLIGGETLSCPDNLLFDPVGNLWVCTDISGSSIGKSPYKKFKHNGLFIVPTEGRYAGEAFQVGSAPNDAELTGLCLTPNKDGLFLSVQHPGERSKSLDEPSSHWPDGGSSKPRSSVVRISGEIFTKMWT